MICNQKFQVITCLTVFIAVIVFPFHLFAQQTQKTMEHEAGFYYTVEKGDTLWSLSKRFSDSPWQWPSLWKENDQIANPHWIYPGERIRLFHEKGIENYVFNAVEKKPEPPKEPPREAPYYYYSPIDSIGFIQKTPAAPLGSIFKVKDDHALIGLGDLVYIRPQGDQPLVLNEKYIVYRTLEPLVDKKTRTLIGTQHYLAGIVKITKNEPSFVTAVVVQTFSAIHVGDLLMPYNQRSPKITLTESPKGLTGKIIASQNQDKIMGDSTIAFIDKGHNDGVKSGQSYTLFYQDKQHLDPQNKQAVFLTPVDYGTLLVLHTEPTTATVLITRPERAIKPGATFHSPE